MSPILVITTMPDRASATSLAQTLIDEHVAACVNVLADCASFYRWQGKSETAVEVPVLIKTTDGNYSKLEQRIMSLHPYELPELIAVPITNGLPAYLKWIGTETLDSNAE